MQELVKLRQHQQVTDHQLQNMGQRVQIMEQRQQQMMSFLAKTMQSPGLFAQFVQQQNESNRNITGGNKKRRLPNQGESVVGESRTNAPEGHIIKFQHNPDAFLFNDAPFTNMFNRGNSLNRVFGVTLSEFPPISAELYMPAEPEFPIGSASTANSDIQSSSYAMPDHATEAQFPNLDVYNSQEETVLPNFTDLQGIMPKSTAEIPDMNLVGSESGNASYLDPMSLLDGSRPIKTGTFCPQNDLEDPMSLLDGSRPRKTGTFYPQNDVDTLLDEIPILPETNDTFWEQILTGTPVTEDVDEINLSLLDGDVTMDHELQMRKKNGLDKIQNMKRLTEQMGLLGSESRRG